MNAEQFAIETARAVTRYISTPEGRIAFDEWKSDKAEIAELKSKLHEMRSDLCTLCGKHDCGACRWKEG